MIKLSVIIPTYTPQNYLFSCLAATFNQDYIRNEDYEVLVILNGPRNPYEEKIGEFLSQSKQLNTKLIYTHLVGVSNARNIGIAESKGQFLCFIDDDDLISKNYLWNLLSAAKESEIVVSNVLTFKDDINITDIDYLGIAYNKCAKRNNYNIFLYRSFLSSSCGKIIPKSLIANKRFNNKYILSEDSLFMFCISDKLKKINLANKSCIYYRRIRDNSASRTERSKYKLIANNLSLACSYTAIYLKAFYQYNFFLYVSRLVGLIITVIKR